MSARKVTEGDVADRMDISSPTSSALLGAVVLSCGAVRVIDRSITTLTIPGSFQKLIITLRRDASTLAKGAKIASARLYYNANPTATLPGDEVLPCTDTTHGTLPQLGIPCINRRTEFTKKLPPALAELLAYTS